MFGLIINETTVSNLVYANDTGLIAENLDRNKCKNDKHCGNQHRTKKIPIHKYK